MSGIWSVWYGFLKNADVRTSLVPELGGSSLVMEMLLYRTEIPDAGMPMLATSALNADAQLCK